MSDAPQTPDPADAAPAEPATADERLAALERELVDTRREGLAHLRRALLAEHAGGLVPELVAGDSAEGLEASVAVATAAFEAAREAALAELRREQAARAAPSAEPMGGSSTAGGSTSGSTAGQPATPARAVPVVPSVPPATPARDLVEPEPRSPLQRIAAGLRRAY